MRKSIAGATVHLQGSFHGTEIFIGCEYSVRKPTKKQPNQQVLRQLELHAGEYCTAVTVWHEMHYGLERLPDSPRKLNLLAYLAFLDQSGFARVALREARRTMVGARTGQAFQARYYDTSFCRW